MSAMCSYETMITPDPLGAGAPSAEAEERWR